jgi:two-component system sensor histidine kinase VicK
LLSLFLFQNERLFHIFKYRIFSKYASEFEHAYSYVNLKQVTVLSTVLLCITLGVRLTSVFYHNELASMPFLPQYNILNWVQITGSSLFLITSKFALQSEYWKTTGRNILVLAFCLFLLTSSFTVSYLFSLENPKNTLTIFLTGVVAVSVFFALEFRYIITISFYVILLFVAAMIIPEISTQQKLLNVIMSGVLAFFLYACSRYGYYFKAEQFVKVKQLEEKNAEVVELNQQKSEILGFVAHDLRNPLNNIEALSRILIEDGKEDTELQLILTSTRQAKNIINDLIEVIQQDKSPFLVQPTDLVPFIQGICANWQANVKPGRKINFKTKESKLFANINASKFTRAVDNLIGNGLKFSEADTPIDITLTKKDQSFELSISDHGIGIPDELKTMLFDQFSKAGRTGLNGEKSIGLGLHISKNIIEQHGATLSLESTENQGTTFRISAALA